MARPLKTKEELKKETEEAFLKEFGITKEAAEKSAAGEKGLYELEPKEFLDKVYDPVKAVTTEPMLFRDEDGEKDEKGPFWYSSFIRNFEAEQARENKEEDLPGFKPEEKTSIETEREILDKLETEKKEKYPGGITVFAVRSGIKAGRNGKVNTDFSEYDFLEEEIEKRKNNILILEQQEKTAEQKGILNSSKKMEEASKGFANWQSFNAQKEAKKRKEEKEGGAIGRIFSAMGSSPDTTSTSGWANVVMDLYRNDTQYKKPNDKWTNEEKYIFGYYWGKGDYKKAEEFAISVNDFISKEEKESIINDYGQKATKNDFKKALYSAGTIAVSPLAGVADYFDNYIEFGARGTVTENSIPSIYELSQGIRNSIGDSLSEEHGELAKDAYNLAMESGDVLFSSAIGGNVAVATSSFGKGAAGAYYDAIERGAEPKQALDYGAVVGTAEMIPDLISTFKLDAIKNSGTINIFKENINNEIWSEISGGVSSEIVTVLADEFIMKNKSEFNFLVTNYQMLGYTKEEAEKEAYKNVRNGVLLSAAMGFFEGSIKILPRAANDALQYNYYRNMLGKNAPETIDDYWNLRYNSGEWEQYEDYADSVIKGDLSAFADFGLYKKIDEEIEDSLVGIVANGGIRIKGKSSGFVNNVIGSVDIKQSGVEIIDIQKALKTNPIKIGDDWCYSLDGVCRVYVNAADGSLEKVNPW